MAAIRVRSRPWTAPTGRISRLSPPRDNRRRRKPFQAGGGYRKAGWLDDIEKGALTVVHYALRQRRRALGYCNLVSEKLFLRAFLVAPPVF